MEMSIATETPTLDAPSLPTHVAQVMRRVDVASIHGPAAEFLMITYLFEVALKSIAVALHASLSHREPDQAHAMAYELIRADGLGAWEAAITRATSPPLTRGLPPEALPVAAWAAKKRTKADDQWF